MEHKMQIKKTLFNVLIALAFSGSTAFADQKSGYLGDAYPKLKTETAASGDKVKRWLSPELLSGKYTAAMLKETAFFPEPKPTEQVSADLLNEIRAYADTALRRELDGVIDIVDEPGPNVLIFNPAITAASAQDERLKAYELIPVAFVFSRVKKASGSRSKEAVLAMEWQVQDAESNEVIGAGIRAGVGSKLKAPDDQVTLENLKPLLDVWAKDAGTFFKSSKAK